MIALWNLIDSAIGRVIVSCLAFLAWTAYQRHDAARDARAECKATQMAQTITEIIRQRDAAKRALEMARDQAKQTTAEMSTLQRDHDQLQQEFKDAKASCAVPDAARRRMLNIR